MEKVWDVELRVNRCFLNWRGKEKWIKGNSLWPYSTSAENEEEAKQKIKKRYNELNAHLFEECIDVDYQFGDITNWDNWTVREAINRLNGKQFSQWAQQQGLSFLVKELA